MAAFAAKHGAPEAVGLGGEHVLGKRRLHDPRRLLQLVLELAGPPAGVAGEDAHTRQLAHLGRILDLAREKADRAEDKDARPLGVIELAQHDDRLLLHRAADVNQRVRVNEVGERRRRLADRDLGGPVEDDAHGALVAVLAHQHHGAVEVGVEQAGRRDEQLSAQRGHSGILMERRRLVMQYDRGVPTTSREVRLVARPQGVPDEGLFEVAEVTLPDPAEGQVLIRNAYLSVDPYMRGRMSDRRSYVSPFALGEAMTGGAVGRVVVSRNDRWPEGAWVLHQLGWRELALSDGGGLLPVDPSLAPVSTALGVLGMPGFTAWYGLTELGEPKAGETVFVSAAAGAVGSVVGQVAKLLGCRVVGSAGSEEKLAWLRELGFDAVFTYRGRAVHEALREAAPDGIDIYFDNVGGDHLEAALGAMRTRGRIVACGAISRYNDAEPQPGPRNLFMLFTKRLTARGFIISDHYDRVGDFLAVMGPWVRDGEVQYRETIVEGIDDAPRAFLGLLGGENTGKMLVRVGPTE